MSNVPENGSAEEQKLTARGRRTRARLIDAARVVFPKHGFLDTKVTDITAEAGTASGTFYTYFDSKEAVFRAAIDVVNDRIYEVVASTPDAIATPFERIEHATRSYITAYRADAGMLIILEQVATFVPEFKDMRHQIRTQFRSRTERGIQRWQKAGLVDKELPAKYAADALTSMVANFCYMWLLFEEEYDTETVIYTLTRMWAQALGLPRN